MTLTTMSEALSDKSDSTAKWRAVVAEKLSYGDLGWLEDVRNQENSVTYGKVVGEALWQAMHTGQLDTAKVLADILNSSTQWLNIVTELLTQVVKAGDLEVFKVLMGTGLNLDRTLAVWEAARYAQPDMLRVLLPDDMDDEDRETLVYELEIDDGIIVMAADVPGNLECVELLLDRGCDINLPDWHHLTPLQRAVTNQDWDMVRLLRRKGANLFHGNRGQLAFQMALDKGHKDIAIQELVSEDINMQNPLIDDYCPEMAGYSMLMHVCHTGHLEGVKTLVEDLEADVDTAVQGKRPVEMALEHRHQDVVQYLLTHVKVHTADFDPIAWMLEKKVWNAEVISHFMDRGVDPNRRFENGETALMIVCSNCDDASARVLLAHGANPNIVAANHKTALWCAVPSLQCTQQIIQANPDMYLTSNKVLFSVANPNLLCNTLHKALLFIISDISLIKILVSAGCSLQGLVHALEGVKDKLKKDLYKELLRRSSEPRSLQEECKIVMKNCLGHSNVDQTISHLPLASHLQDYLLTSYIDPVFQQM